MSNITITNDMDTLRTGSGYLSTSKEVKYNPTTNTCVIDESLISNVGETLDEFFLGNLKKEVKSLKQSLASGEISAVQYHLKVRPFTDTNLKELSLRWNIDIGDEEKEEKLVNSIIEDGFNINAKPVDLTYIYSSNISLPPTFIDFKAMQDNLALSDVDFVTLLLKSIFCEFTPQSIKKVNGKLHLPYKKEDFLASAFMELLSAIVFKINIESKKDVYYSIDSGLINLFDSHYFHGDTDNYQMFIYQVRTCFRLAIEFYINRNAIFTPFSKATVVMGRITLIDFPKGNNELLTQIKSVIDSKEDPGRTQALKRLSRGLCCSTNIEKIQELPESLCVDYINAALEYNEKIGYAETITEHPQIAIRHLITSLERTDLYRNQTDFKTFNLGALKKASMKRIIEGELARNNTSLARYKHKLSDQLLDEFRTYTLMQANSQNMQYFNHFIDFVIAYNSQSKEQITSIDLLKLEHFYHARYSDDFSFYNYLANLESRSALSSKRVIWSQVRKALNHMFIAKTRGGSSKTVPMPLAQEIYRNVGSRRTITSRRSLPTELYSICLEVVTENNYQFIKDNSPSRTVSLFNYLTDKHEKVFVPNDAHILHLLLVIPCRSHQARWIDEGLLDDFIWDFDRQAYVANTAFTANFRYLDGKTHTQKFGKTAFIQSINPNGNDGMLLYFNTNKTKGYTLQKNGHTGYSIPWVLDTGIPNVDAVVEIIKKQKEFNDKFSPKQLMPVRTVDEDAGKYSPVMFDMLPKFIPLFRDITWPKSSVISPELGTIYLPPRSSRIRGLYHDVLKEAEVRYKKKYPQHESLPIAFAEDGTCLYDLHGLRVYGITELLNSGLDKEIVKLLVGHATSIMTLYYRQIGEREYKKALLEAQHKTGASLLNEQDALKYGLDKIEWINNSSLVDEFKSYAPDFSKEGEGGLPKFSKGGICMSFNCEEGGVIVKVNDNGTNKNLITSVRGGAFRCGNCRYWRSNHRFIDEQIYYVNECAMEVKALYDERHEIYEKINKAYDNHDDPELIVARYNSKADATTELLCHRITEFRRRQNMLAACFETVKLEYTQMLVPIGNQKENLSPVRYESLGMLDASMELSMQAVMLGLDSSESKVHVNKLDQFLNKLFSEAAVKNPLLYIPSDEVKRSAVLFAAFRAKELLGDVITDEEFDDPRLLFGDMKKVAKLIEGLKALDISFKNSVTGIENED